jgi:oligopeptide/dipeptide ABC transporter ATP-binding protein
MALILVSHDMGVIAETCDRVAVMYAGRIVESAPVKAIFDAPAHPYMAGLLGSMVSGEHAVGRLEPIPGQPPDLAELGPGCAFAPRCGRAAKRCRDRPIPLVDLEEGHRAACLSRFLPPRLSDWRSCVEDTSPVGDRRQVYPGSYRYRWPDGGVSDRTFADVSVERRASACRSGRGPCEPVHRFGRNARLSWRERKRQDHVGRALLGLNRPTSAVFRWTAAISTISLSASARICHARSRWCCRIPTARSIRVPLSARPCLRRFAFHRIVTPGEIESEANRLLELVGTLEQNDSAYFDSTMARMFLNLRRARH